MESTDRGLRTERSLRTEWSVRAEGSVRTEGSLRTEGGCELAIRHGLRLTNLDHRRAANCRIAHHELRGDAHHRARCARLADRAVADRRAIEVGCRGGDQRVS